MESRPAQGIAGIGIPSGTNKTAISNYPEQMVQDALWGRGVHHYRGNPPQLRYTPTADAACRCRGNPSLLRYTPTADAACCCRGNTLQRRDSAAGHGGDHSRACRNRANHATAGWSLGNQTVASLPSSWAGHLIEHPKVKPKPLKAEHLRKKKGFLMSSVAAESNIAA